MDEAAMVTGPRWLLDVVAARRINGASFLPGRFCPPYTADRLMGRLITLPFIRSYVAAEFVLLVATWHPALVSSYQRTKTAAGAVLMRGGFAAQRLFLCGYLGIGKGR